ncbi:MAG: GntR family transcriptional regulator [Proteobacteria bacterium]|nr:GntR family transcriptional regulator [Pseudomonadota bacterium]
MRGIVALLRSGELKPGAIVNEAELAKRFGMSRGPVREAVRRLEGRKLVVREAYQRARVVTLDRAAIVGIFELRECLEGMACRLAATHMTDAALERLARDTERAGTRNAFTVDYRFSFHQAIVDGCGNARIGTVLAQEVYDLVRLYRWSSGALPGRAGAAPAEHRAIAAALRKRDADRAEALMREHVRRSMQMVVTA